jgi:glyoxylase-like metal-dependent hydrolase (beta-lactamase superfamily II)
MTPERPTHEVHRVLHFPSGHTDGDSIIFFPKSNVVHGNQGVFNRGNWVVPNRGNRAVKLSTPAASQEFNAR